MTELDTHQMLPTLRLRMLEMLFVVFLFTISRVPFPSWKALKTWKKVKISEILAKILGKVMESFYESFLRETKTKNSCKFCINVVMELS